MSQLHSSVKELFLLERRSPKGFYEADCPFCGKEGHLGISLGELTEGKYHNVISFRCLKCEERGGVKKLLDKIGRLDLLKYGKSIDLDKDLEKNLSIYDTEEVEEVEVPDRHLPLGFKRVLEDSYMDARGFEPWQYSLYVVGRTKLISTLKDYVLFPIIEEGANKGYVARSTRSKEWIDIFNSKVKEFNNSRAEGVEKRHKYLRYRNESVDFGKLVYGIDELRGKTTRIYGVEGVTDKFNVDRMNSALDLLDTHKCICSFGKNMTSIQIEKIADRVDVDSVEFILLYDPDAVDASKETAMEIQKYFPKVTVGFLRESDPGDLDLDEFVDIVANRDSPINFSLGKVLKKI